MDHDRLFAIALTSLNRRDKKTATQCRSMMKQGVVTFSHRVLHAWVKKSEVEPLRLKRQAVADLLALQYPSTHP